MLPAAVQEVNLTSAIRYDSALLNFSWNSVVNDGQPSSFMLLRYHFDRLKAAAALHGWEESFTWPSFQHICQHAVDSYDGPAKGGPLKLRLLLHRTGTFATTVTPTHPLNTDPMLAAHISPSMDTLPQSLGDPINLFLDMAATTSSLFTITKTTYRTHYAAARARLGLPDVGGSADVLLWNTKGMLTETSVRNFALFRRGRWVTPHDSTGCLRGVTRRWLIEQGLVATDNEALLHKNTVQEGELVLIFNAVEGCRIAVTHLCKA
ncbi:aminotransferase [Multifurca ochricompacta]|uniref:Aminotransferase n=1 Tax=Multifurca ochricompacta TaxID=376703 RepID=A0AAD4MG98_9AGAM|nr:aminotransferase [Multifurca ochricompacta]